MSEREKDKREEFMEEESRDTGFGFKLSNKNLFIAVVSVIVILLVAYFAINFYLNGKRLEGTFSSSRYINIYTESADLYIEQGEKDVIEYAQSRANDIQAEENASGINIIARSGVVNITLPSTIERLEIESGSGNIELYNTKANEIEIRSIGNERSSVTLDKIEAEHITLSSGSKLTMTNSSVLNASLVSSKDTTIAESDIENLDIKTDADHFDILGGVVKTLNAEIDNTNLFLDPENGIKEIRMEGDENSIIEEREDIEGNPDGLDVRVKARNSTIEF